MDAASEVVTETPSNVTAATIANSTDTFNVNQSNNNAHTHANSHIGSNSLPKKTTNNIINNTNSSLSIGGSGNSNSSCSSSSTSSNSSGYGSSTTTPTNNYDLQNTTPTTTPIPATPVAHTEHIIPVATVAAVTPFYNESITTHNLETQNIQHHHLHTQQPQQQLQQQQHHMLQSNHHQYSQNHLQTNLQEQHHQYLPRQQYYSPYDYQQPAPMHNLSGPSATPAVAPYNMIIPGPYEMPAVNASYDAGHYKSAIATGVTSYDRSSLVKANLPAPTVPTYNQQQPQHSQQQQPKAINQHFTGLLGASKQRASSLISNTASNNTSKPQAAATPFYANPTPFYDNFKHKIPLEYHDTYNNPSPATAVTYQQQKYYAAAKSQLKESPYGSPAGVNSKAAYANTSSIFPGPAATYDKYIYPHASTTGYATTSHLGNETPPEVSNYRKPVVGTTMNSPSWPWGIEYASGNSRSIPPPSSHIPTATVAPTHAAHLTQNPSALSRDPYYISHDKYGGKYDKYSSPSYPQTYVNPPSNRHMWSNTPHASNLTQLNERHLHPPALSSHGLHTAPYFSNSSTAGINSRQACCSQPFQPQNCYYPASHAIPPRLPHNQSPAVVPPAVGYFPTQQTLGQSPHLNALTASCKFGGVLPDYGNANKIKTSNDLYINSHHYDNNPPPHNFAYGTAHNGQQMYNNNAHQSIVHGAAPASLLSSDPLNANPTSYTNDLSLTTSNFDSYHTHLDPHHPNQQPLNNIHNPQPSPSYGPTVAKRALLDYRKPIQPQPPPTIAEDCYTTLTTREHYNQLELLNTPETTTTFGEYEVHQSNANDLSTEVLDDSEDTRNESNKNLSLRDFIANWNDDEDEYQNNEGMHFDETAVINEVLQAAPVAQVAAAEVVTIQEVKVIKPSTLVTKDTEALKEPAKAAEDLIKTLDDAEANQYVNLPDIVIDIEKSSNVNNSITTPTASPTPPPTLPEINSSSLNLTDFDVEKELDELNLKKPTQQESTKDLNDFKNVKDSKDPITTQMSPLKNATSLLSFENLNVEPTNKTVLSAITTRLTTNQGSELNEQYLKDIEGYESSCSRHSNESAFEKEYETFIHKITSESCTTTNAEKKTCDAEKDNDFEKNVQDFSKFYKRKRKLKEDELKLSLTATQSHKKLKTAEAAKVNNSNFPQVYTKKCRNRMLKAKPERSHKRKPRSAYYKIIHSIRRFGLHRGKQVRAFMTELKEKHLPLIKRQSIKNYSHDVTKSLINAKSLKALCIMVFNTEEFRQRLMSTAGQTAENCLEPEEKHICTDPTCETCEVIKSLMEAESFEATLMQQQSNEPATILCAESNKETITILEDVSYTNDLSFCDEEPTLISSEVENIQYLPELVSLETPSDRAEVELQTRNCPAVVLQTAFESSIDTSFAEFHKFKTDSLEIELQTEKHSHLFTKSVTYADAEPDKFDTNSTNHVTPVVRNLIKPMAQTIMYKNSHSEIDIFTPESDLNRSKETTLISENLDNVETLDILKKEHFSLSIPFKDVNSTITLENVLEQCFDGKDSFDKISEDENKSLDPLNNETPLVIKPSKESLTEESDSSGSWSDSSSSDTEDKSVEESMDSYKKPTRDNERNANDTEYDLDEDEATNENPNQSHHAENIKSTNKEEIKETDVNVCENGTRICNSAVKPRIDNKKRKRETENVIENPQRIVIRITKSLSPNEQSLRVENVIGKSFISQADNRMESKTEDAAHEKTEESSNTSKQNSEEEDNVYENPGEIETECKPQENSNPEKKLVTPLKLVLRGREYFRFKASKKSLKLQSRLNYNSDSEADNKSTSGKKPEIYITTLSTGNKQADDKEEDSRERELGDNTVLEKISVTVPPSPKRYSKSIEESHEQLGNKEEESKIGLATLEPSGKAEEMKKVSEQKRDEDLNKMALNNQSEICLSPSELGLRQENVLVKEDNPEKMLTPQTPTLMEKGSKENNNLENALNPSSECEKSIESSMEAVTLDDNFEILNNSVAESVESDQLNANDTLILNNEIVREMKSGQTSNPISSLDHSGENNYSHDGAQRADIEKAKVLMSENFQDPIKETLDKTISLENIETYSLSDSDEETETETHSISDSEDYSDPEDESCDGDESCESMTMFDNLKPIVISDDDSTGVSDSNDKFQTKIKSFSNIPENVKQEVRIKLKESESQKSRIDEENEIVNKNHIVNESYCSKSPKQVNDSNVIDKYEDHKAAVVTSLESLKAHESLESQLIEDQQSAKSIDISQINVTDDPEKYFSDHSSSSLDSDLDFDSKKIEHKIRNEQLLHSSEKTLVCLHENKQDSREEERQISLIHSEKQDCASRKQSEKDATIENVLIENSEKNKTEYLNPERCNIPQAFSVLEDQVRLEIKTFSSEKATNKSYNSLTAADIKQSTDNEAESHCLNTNLDTLNRNQCLKDNSKGTTEHEIILEKSVIQQDAKSNSSRTSSPIPESCCMLRNKDQKNLMVNFEFDRPLKDRQQGQKGIFTNIREHRKISEELIMQADTESSSSYCSSISEEDYYNPQNNNGEFATNKECVTGKLYLSTKTKAAYKLYDLQNDVQEDDLSDSESEKPNDTNVNFSSIEEKIELENHLNETITESEWNECEDLINADEFKSSAAVPLEPKNICVNTSREIRSLEKEPEESDITANSNSLTSNKETIDQTTIEAGKIASEESTSTKVIPISEKIPSQANIEASELFKEDSTTLWKESLEAEPNFSQIGNEVISDKFFILNNTNENIPNSYRELDHENDARHSSITENCETTQETKVCEDFNDVNISLFEPEVKTLTPENMDIFNISPKGNDVCINVSNENNTDIDHNISHVHCENETKKSHNVVIESDKVKESIRSEVTSTPEVGSTKKEAIFEAGSRKPVEIKETVNKQKCEFVVEQMPEEIEKIERQHLEEEYDSQTKEAEVDYKRFYETSESFESEELTNELNLTLEAKHASNEVHEEGSFEAVIGKEALSEVSTTNSESNISPTVNQEQSCEEKVEKQVNISEVSKTDLSLLIPNEAKKEGNCEEKFGKISEVSITDLKVDISNEDDEEQLYDDVDGEQKVLSEVSAVDLKCNVSNELNEELRCDEIIQEEKTFSDLKCNSSTEFCEEPSYDEASAEVSTTDLGGDVSNDVHEEQLCTEPIDKSQVTSEDSTIDFECNSSYQTNEKSHCNETVEEEKVTSEVATGFSHEANEVQSCDERIKVQKILAELTVTDLKANFSNEINEQRSCDRTLCEPSILLALSTTDFNENVSNDVDEERSCEVSTEGQMVLPEVLTNDLKGNVSREVDQGISCDETVQKQQESSQEESYDERERKVFSKLSTTDLEKNVSNEVDEEQNCDNSIGEQEVLAEISSNALKENISQDVNEEKGYDEIIKECKVFSELSTTDLKSNVSNKIGEQRNCDESVEEQMVLAETSSTVLKENISKDVNEEEGCNEIVKQNVLAEISSNVLKENISQDVNEEKGCDEIIQEQKVLSEGSANDIKGNVLNDDNDEQSCDETVHQQEILSEIKAPDSNEVYEETICSEIVEEQTSSSTDLTSYGIVKEQNYEKTIEEQKGLSDDSTSNYEETIEEQKTLSGNSISDFQVPRLVEPTQQHRKPDCDVGLKERNLNDEEIENFNTNNKNCLIEVEPTPQYTKPDCDVGMKETNLNDEEIENLNTNNENYLIECSLNIERFSKNREAKTSDKTDKSKSFGGNPKQDQQTLPQNDKLVPAKNQTDEEIITEQLVEKINKFSGDNVDKHCITPDELTRDFYGFKHQSSFEEESEDFHGFEDLEEVTRIRQEIENLNDDSAANDGFLNNITLNRQMHKTSTTSLADSVSSEINELEALEKELSQHQLAMHIADEDEETEQDLQVKTVKVVSTNDIEHIKQMLESDEEQPNDGEYEVEMLVYENNNISVSSIIPKLSDLCRAALNSSLNSSNNLAQQHTETSTILVERELSVEEALAEMYRQAGVLLSDPEDCDNDISSPGNSEAHDVLLINLQEILNSDNNDVYVLQCDMNENVLNVVQSSGEHEEVHQSNDGVNTERVNTVQIILDTQNAEPQIHIISSDSESEVIILSDDDSEVSYRPFRAREERVTIPFINDDDSLFDISTIHHEEIVPDNLNKFLQEEFYKYLHEKYVQRNISKYYHANRVLKKYKRRFLRTNRL